MPLDPDEQRARAGEMAASLLDVVDEDFLQVYQRAGDELGILLAEMIKRGITPEAAFGQMHVLCVSVQMSAIAAAAEDGSGG